MKVYSLEMYRYVVTFSSPQHTCMGMNPRSSLSEDVLIGELQRTNILRGDFEDHSDTPLVAQPNDGTSDKVEHSQENRKSTGEEVTVIIL